MRAALFTPALLCGAALTLGAARAEPAAITIRVDQPGPAVPSSMYGIFYEEINHAGDGGLYAEMIQNRSFEETVPIEGCTLENGVCRGPVAPNYKTGQDKDWSHPWPFPTPWPAWSLETTGGAEASMSIETNAPVHPKNVNYLRLKVAKLDGGGVVRLQNDGYWGIAVDDGEVCECSFFARTAEGAAPASVRIGLINANGGIYAEETVNGIGAAWKKFTCKFQTKGPARDAKFFLRPMTTGTLELDVVSLFPAKTFKNRPNGMRPDIAQLLADLKPAFMRFPGGCVVEGATYANRVQWKETIGPIETRPGHWSLWGYRNVDGIGYHEFLQFCEDVGADGMFVCNVGLSCTFRNGDYLPAERLDEQIQDTLDAIEYALGGPDTKWGAERVKNGHPAPFPLKYLEIGNENGGPIYDRYYDRFAAAVGKAWPKLTLICNVRKPGITMVDEHYYRDPQWFFDNAEKYDRVSRKPLIYVGEYACNKGVGHGNLLAGLSEAAFLLGMERNSDAVVMASYAPLLFNVHDIKWPVNLIGFDNHVSFGRSSYYVQKLFANHRPDLNVGCAVTPPAGAGKGRFGAVAGLDRKAGELVVKVLNADPKAATVKFALAGARKIGAAGRVITLTGQPDEENDVKNPTRIVPVEQAKDGFGEAFTLDLPPSSLTVLRIPVTP